jgi:hypothetical protein
MVCVPAVSELQELVATPAPRETDGDALPSSLNVTEPVGITRPVPITETVTGNSSRALRRHQKASVARDQVEQLHTHDFAP